MKVLFQLSHPAHFHMFKHLMNNLINDGHEAIVLIRPKDILEKLCIDAGVKYINIGNKKQATSKFSKLTSVVQRTLTTIKVVKKEKPDILLGSDGVLAFTGILCNKASFEFFDDDYSVIKLYANLFFPFYSCLVAPNITSAGRWESKKVGYDGYQKLSYLHPNRFTPNPVILEKYNLSDKKYFLIRLSALTAHHDGGIGGIVDGTVKHIIQLLEPHGSVYITTERPLTPEFEKYRLTIDPLDMHHIMAFATLYIGDSQSMAVEAAMLGTPGIRFNSFAGRISVLEELQNKYQLTFGISNFESEALFHKIEELLNTSDLSNLFHQRQQKMLADKIDVTAFWTWFIENYPESKKIMKENPDYQYRFR